MKKINREFFSPTSLRLREAPEGGDSRLIEGYAIVFDTPSVAFYEDERDVVREVIDKEAVTMDLLDASDIKMTLFHDRTLILARSKGGEGTLTYGIDDHGVSFSFEAPHTADGDKAVELVRRGDISGCSFAFTTYYDDETYVSQDVATVAGKRETTYHVKRISGIYDFTLAADPAYDATSVEAREAFTAQRAEAVASKARQREQLDEMRAAVGKYSNFV